MEPKISLVDTSRQDVARIGDWLKSSQLSDFWYGVDEYKIPLHIGYSPYKILKADQNNWDKTFGNDTRKIMSIYDENEGHIGEAQILIEPALHEAQLFFIIGRTDLWFKHYGFAALLQLLDIVFFTYKLHRAWVDVPDYNVHASHLVERVGFILEGHLRSTHPKDGKWHDSMIMGLLETEYLRRRPNLVKQLDPQQ